MANNPTIPTINALDLNENATFSGKKEWPKYKCNMTNNNNDVKVNVFVIA